MEMSFEERKALRCARQARAIRRVFLLAMTIGLITGFVIGQMVTFAGQLCPGPDVRTGLTEQEQLQDEGQPTETEQSIHAEPVNVYLGQYRVTAYCSCEKCCGQWALNRPNGIVYGASGEELIAGVSCASPLPFGTVVTIDGVGTFTVQDRTSNWVVNKYGQNVIDIYFDNHEEAAAFGLQYLDVYQVV